MLCAVVGQRIWLFNAPDKVEGRKIANIILSFEKTGANSALSGLETSHKKHRYAWEARAIELTDEIEQLIREIDKKKIIEIKRRRPPVIDVLYLTRMQKERWGTK